MHASLTVALSCPNFLYCRFGPHVLTTTQLIPHTTDLRCRPLDCGTTSSHVADTLASSSPPTPAQAWAGYNMELNVCLRSKHRPRQLFRCHAFICIQLFYLFMLSVTLYPTISSSLPTLSPFMPQKPDQRLRQQYALSPIFFSRSSIPSSLSHVPIRSDFVPPSLDLTAVPCRLRMDWSVVVQRSYSLCWERLNI